MKIADDKKAILFTTTDGDMIVRADAECCSETWIENIELPASGFPAKVLSVDDLAMPELQQPEDGRIEHYGCKITTNKGEIIIDYRNESNGYYGGSLCWPSEHYYGGVFKQNVSSENWINIEE